MAGTALLLAQLGCPQPTPSAPPTSDASEEAEEPPLLPVAPANREAGDRLDLTIPLLGVDPVDLASFGGRPVVLEISASWEPGWAEMHAFESEVVQQHPDLVVIVVATEPSEHSLMELAVELSPAWDPAGALAAKLSIATLPTVFVLDRSGRVVAVLSGWDDETLDVLAQAIDVALADPVESAVDENPSE